MCSVWVVLATLPSVCLLAHISLVETTRPNRHREIRFVGHVHHLSVYPFVCLEFAFLQSEGVSRLHEVVIACLLTWLHQPSARHFCFCIFRFFLICIGYNLAENATIVYWWFITQCSFFVIGLDNCHLTTQWSVPKKVPLFSRRKKECFPWGGFQLYKSSSSFHHCCILAKLSDKAQQLATDIITCHALYLTDDIAISNKIHYDSS